MLFPAPLISILPWILLLVICGLAQDGARQESPLLPGKIYFSCQFERSFQQEPQPADTTSGELFFLGKDKMFIRIEKPLRQILLLDGNETTVYYPDQRRAFLLISRHPAIMPIVPGLMSALRYQQGMAEMGFELAHQEMQADTLVTAWRHPQIPETSGSYRLGEVDDRLVYSRFEGDDQNFLTLTRFDNYQKSGKMYFPSLLITTVVRDAVVSHERIVLNNLQTNAQVPAEVLNFAVPDDVEVERRRW